MNFFSNLLGQPSTNARQGETTSLLSDWNNYSHAKSDVEAGPSTSDTLFKTVDKAGSKVAEFFQSGVTTVSTGVSRGVAALPSAETFSIPTGQQLIYFFSFLAGGGVFLMLAFTIFLPTLIIAPSKFAMSFTLGCLCIMASFSALRGWKNQVQHMLSRERLPFSAAYVGSIVATLYAALVMHSYILCIICSGGQVVALLYYVMSYFPGGTEGVKFMLNLFYNAVSSCFGRILSK
mmetsp:Transcript_26139/g.57135  ORF Transcript_26139/g.57135 Transcript_26139/m.57135 type:complete len:234 (-) Transcript_26139:294-995(-)